MPEIQQSNNPELDVIMDSESDGEKDVKVRLPQNTMRQHIMSIRKIVAENVDYHNVLKRYLDLHKLEIHKQFDTETVPVWKII